MKGWRKVKKLMSKSRCASGSFRYKSVGKKTKLLICCPTGYWNKRAERCEVGTRAYEVLKRR